MVLEKIIAIIAEKMELEASAISAGSNFEELRVDSLAMVEIMLAIEEEFDITIDNAEGIETVADVAAYVQKKLS